MKALDLTTTGLPTAYARHAASKHYSSRAVAVACTTTTSTRRTILLLACVRWWRPTPGTRADSRGQLQLGTLRVAGQRPRAAACAARAHTAQRHAHPPTARPPAAVDAVSSLAGDAMAPGVARLGGEDEERARRQPQQARRAARLRGLQLHRDAVPKAERRDPAAPKARTGIGEVGRQTAAPHAAIGPAPFYPGPREAANASGQPGQPAVAPPALRQHGALSARGVPILEGGVRVHVRGDAHSRSVLVDCDLHAAVGRRLLGPWH